MKPRPEERQTEDMAFADRLDDVKDFKARLPNLTAGAYVLELTDIQEERSVQTKKDIFRQVVKVIEATGTGATPVGTTACHSIIEGKYDFAEKEIISFVRALINEPTAKVTGDMLKNLTGPKKPEFIGTKYRIELKPVAGKTRQDGSPVLNAFYFPFEGGSKS